MILFSAIDIDDCLGAYHWHRGFSGANDALFPRQFDDFEQLVMEGSVWAARDSAGDYLALAYASFNEDTKECEVGGLMVATQARGRGLGAMMMSLALAHALIEEDILIDPEVRVVAHVLRSNDKPRGIIEKKLMFHLAKSVCIPGDKLPGLRTEDDGNVHGDEYELTIPDSLIALADWARSWTGQLPGDEMADIELRAGVSMKDWCDALDEMAARPIRVAKDQIVAEG